jgi:short-chain 2-methylacyl-CoA dehydrogenase
MEMLRTARCGKMDFELTEVQEMIRKEVRNFAQREIVPRAEEMEQTGVYPYDIMAKMGALGFMGIPFPAEYGGSGGNWVEMH